MMPKEVLTDRAIRSEVVPGLSLQILERFQPDDFAADPLPKGEPYDDSSNRMLGSFSKKTGSSSQKLRLAPLALPPLALAPPARS